MRAIEAGYVDVRHPKALKRKIRFVFKIEFVDDGCWYWTGTKNKDGYGTIGHTNTTLMAHRVSFLWVYGHIPDGYHVHHECNNPSCVNPDHLYAVTPRANYLAPGSRSPVKINSEKTHCNSGHRLLPYRPVVTSTGERVTHRKCTECTAEFYARQVEQLERRIH